MNSDLDLAIQVSNLSKMFRVYSRPADMFWETITGKPRYRPFWALQNVSFDVQRGSVMGIIGRNGAGKSTLLKIITGTLDKTTGDVTVDGRISSILELGTGFNAEYTGRENIYLGGLMVGMTREQVKKKENWIIEFSELSDFIDQPFKTYSTGMQARLTFATALCIDPDILIVDEALAVGDAAFQVKCFDKFHELVQKHCTILFVSHDINSINNLCDQAILLDHGEVKMADKPNAVTNYYHQLLFSKNVPSTSSAGEPDQIAGSQVDLQTGDVSVLANSDEIPSHIDEFLSQSALRYGNRQVEFVDLGLLDARGNPVKILQPFSEYIFYCRMIYHQTSNDLTIGLRIRTPHAVDVFAANTNRHKIEIPAGKPGDTLLVRFRVKMVLGPGQYFTTFGVRNVYEENFYDRYVDAFTFSVMADNTTDSACMVNLHEEITTQFRSQ